MLYPLRRGQSEPEVGRDGDSSEVEAESEPEGRARRRPSPEAEAQGRARRSLLLRLRLDLAVVSSPWRVAQQSERGERRCLPVKSVSGRAK